VEYLGEKGGETRDESTATGHEVASKLMSFDRARICCPLRIPGPLIATSGHLTTERTGPVTGCRMNVVRSGYEYPMTRPTIEIPEWTTPFAMSRNDDHGTG
jgi:hypothetical protein